MQTLIEVCIDNITALPIAQNSGANRIELCSALALGGLTPSHGYMMQAKAIAKVPVYAMIRSRDGDFIFQDHEKESMLADIANVKKIGLNGVVIGALTADGKIDLDFVRAMVKEAGSLGVTFHRAFDYCTNPYETLEILITLGVERVLTSGQAKSVMKGKKMLKEMVDFCGKDLVIMPGAGITKNNALDLIHFTKAREIHLSAKTFQQSPMVVNRSNISMGTKGNDYQYLTTDADIITAIRAQLDKKLVTA